jgi:hypothetical protein
MGKIVGTGEMYGLKTIRDRNKFWDLKNHAYPIHPLCSFPGYNKPEFQLPAINLCQHSNRAAPAFPRGQQRSAIAVRALVSHQALYFK